MHGNTKKRVFDQTTLYGKTEHAYFILRAEIGIGQLEKIYLKPPVFVVDDIQVDLSVITFEKTEETFVGGLNC